MDIVEIKARYFSGEYSSKIEIPKVLSPVYVFDENLTIKDNRAMIDEHNKKVEELTQKKREDEAKLNAIFVNDICEYIVEEYGLTKEQARVIQFYCYDNWHYCMSDYFAHIDLVSRFAQSLLQA